MRQGAAEQVIDEPSRESKELAPAAAGEMFSLPPPQG